MFSLSTALRKRVGLLLLIASLSGMTNASPMMGFGGPAYVNVPLYAKNVAVGDFDGSGMDGFVTVSWEMDGKYNAGGPKVAIFLPDHDALKGKSKMAVAFKPPVYLEGQRADSDKDIWEADIAVANVDLKNNDDILLLNSNRHTVSIYLNDGKGNFSSSPIVVDVFPSSLPRFKGPDPFGTGITIDPPDYREHPFQLITGKFNNDLIPDFAVAYVETGSNWGVKADQYAVCVFKGVITPELHYEMASSMTSFTDLAACGALFCLSPTPLRYSWNSPFYSVNETENHADGTPKQIKGNVYQMIAAPFEDRPNDSLWLRINAEHIVIWDPFKGTFAGPTTSLSGHSGVPSVLHGPFAVAPIFKAPGNQDLIFGNGNHIAFHVGTKAEVDDIDPMPPSGPSGAIVAADFNRDGLMDLARITGDDLDSKVAGTDLEVAFGSGMASNLLRYGGVKLIKGMKVLPPWWENQRKLVAGHFTTDSDFITKERFPSLLALGADVVTIYPSIGNNAQLDIPSLGDFISGKGPTVKVGDTVAISGQFYAGSPSEIMSLTLIEDVPSMPHVEVLNRTDLTIKTIPGVGEVLEFKVPAIPSGVYKMTVTNGKQSNEVLLTILP